MAALRDIVIDCADPARLARFWAAALDGYAVAPYDDAEIARLAALGVNDAEDDPTVLVEAPGRSPRYFFQWVPEAKQVKNRMHLDLASADPAAELRRLLDLGATRSPAQPNPGLVVLHDPEGNEFCLLNAVS